jgi:hypothetical protein
MTDIEEHKIMSTKKNESDDLRQQLAELSEKLEYIKVLAGKEQGRWAEFGAGEAPEWTAPFKQIIRIIEN